ncbi:MAG: hypothetical protein A2167_02265 [Planctomycetes bacterium RBG_13_46_10]|nr:MAG: hypothetical protein A2167_02265 [Planctomycetes bacterium RBG_13_46_10]
MNKKSTYLILVIFINTFSAMLAPGAGTKGRTSSAQRTFILPDGFMLKSIDGKLTGKDSNDGWFFEFDSAVLGSSKITGLTKLELLPSSTLERMIADANTSSTMSYRLWASVTKYKGRNFILPTRFLPFMEFKKIPLASASPTESGTTPTTGAGAKPEVQPAQKEPEEMNDELGIPKEILEKLEAGSISPSARRGLLDEPARPIAGRQTKIKQDFILTNRIGFLVKKEDGSMAFNLDALGLSAGSTTGTFKLLPCQVLELTERLQAAEADRVRFKIAGIVTEYQGEGFLLLHRAIRVYNHGNFGR